jgi:hypothetical protein
MALIKEIRRPPPQPPKPPLANSYWVRHGKLLGGEYPGGQSAVDTVQRLRTLQQAGVDCFLNLTRPGELPAYDALLPAGTVHHHLPIPDHGLPTDHAYMRRIQAALTEALAAGRCVYVHCRMGIGRTGTVLGCHLVEQGLSGAEALEELNRAWQQCARASRWPTIPETTAQCQFVAAWRIPPPRG